jgi:hypothetical protein
VSSTGGVLRRLVDTTQLKLALPPPLFSRGWHPVGDPRRRPADANPHSLVNASWFDAAASGLSGDSRGDRAAPWCGANTRMNERRGERGASCQDPSRYYRSTAACQVRPPLVVRSMAG